VFTFAFRPLLFFRSSDRPQALRAVRSSLRTLALSGNSFIADRVLAAVVRALTSTASDADCDDATISAADKIEIVREFPRLEVLRLSNMHAPPSVAACANGMSAFGNYQISMHSTCCFFLNLCFLIHICLVIS
jgi:hypothetical protein